MPTSRQKPESSTDRGMVDQRLLHQWPAWDESIWSARARLGFDPGWTPRPGEPESVEYADWRKRVELVRLVAEANRALINHYLSDRFRDYWLACFLAPYERDGFEAILDPMPDGTIRDVRVFPPPAELWFEAGIDYSSAPFKLVIEGPAALASSTVLRAAERRALDAKRRGGFPSQHPLAHARQVGPVLDERAAERATPNPRRADMMRKARLWHSQGRKPRLILERIRDRGYAISESTVRRWLADAKDSPTR